MTVLEYVLQETGRSPIEIANSLSISRQRLNNWVRGHVEIPYTYINELSNILGIPSFILIKRDINLSIEIFIDEELIEQRKRNVSLKRKKIHGIQEEEIKDLKNISENVLTE